MKIKDIKDIDNGLSKKVIKPNYVVMHPKAAKKWDLFIKMWVRSIRGFLRKHRNL